MTQGLREPRVSNERNSIKARTQAAMASTQTQEMMRSLLGIPLYLYPPPRLAITRI